MGGTRALDIIDKGDPGFSFGRHLASKDLILSVGSSGDHIQGDKFKIEFMLPTLVELIDRCHHTFEAASAPFSLDVSGLQTSLNC